MIKTSTKANIPLNLKPLKSDLGYKGWADQFYQYVHTRDRLSNPITYFLLYDLDDKSYCIRSELTATHNQIVLKTAYIPSKKNIKEDIIIKDCEF